MKRIFPIMIAVSLTACAKHPSQDELELAAFNKVIAERVAKKQLTEAEAELAKQQYAGSLRARESGIEANQGQAAAGSAYANNSGFALGMAMMCAGQRGGHC